MIRRSTPSRGPMIDCPRRVRGSTDWSYALALISMRRVSRAQLPENGKLRHLSGAGTFKLRRPLGPNMQCTTKDSQRLMEYFIPFSSHMNAIKDRVAFQYRETGFGHATRPEATINPLRQETHIN